jgi:hypothetical protein
LGQDKSEHSFTPPPPNYDRLKSKFLDKFKKGKLRRKRLELP